MLSSFLLVERGEEERNREKRERASGKARISRPAMKIHNIYIIVWEYIVSVGF